jgi:DNA-binding MarR family transcriptional regulator
MKASTGRRKPLKVQLDYVTLTLDVINERLKTQATELYQRECGVNLREVRLLRFIASEPGLTLTRLIERASLEKTLASKAITALVRRGLVQRSVGLEDARRISLELTDAGVATVMSAEPIGRFAVRMFTAAMSDEERAIFDRCLQKLAQAGNEIVARRPPGHSAMRRAA